MSSLEIDNCVKMIGGKCKGCEGVIVNIMKLFASVRLTRDKYGKAIFLLKPKKVKRDHIEVIDPPALEMPSSTDLKPVDSLEPNYNLIHEIDQKIIEESKTQNITTVVEEVPDEKTGEVNPNLVYSPKKNAILVDEHGIRSTLPTIDDCINLRDENQKLRLQIESLLSWQSHASAECAKYRKDYIDLKKKHEEEAVKYRKEELIELINKM